MGLAYLIHLVIEALIIVIIADALLSWVPELRYRWRGLTRIIGSITDPILAPFRRLIPPSKTGGLDVSPLLAIIALQILERIIMMVLLGP
jgi:YggT family protein